MSFFFGFFKLKLIGINSQLPQFSHVGWATSFCCPPPITDGQQNLKTPFPQINWKPQVVWLEAFFMATFELKLCKINIDDLMRFQWRDCSSGWLFIALICYTEFDHVKIGKKNRLVQEGGNIHTTEKSDFFKKSDFFIRQSHKHQTWQVFKTSQVFFCLKIGNDWMPCFTSINKFNLNVLKYKLKFIVVFIELFRVLWKQLTIHWRR